jgi:DNA-binding winged helix-turn-helix (wHTH) protein/Tol biopolymer transport system component
MLINEPFTVGQWSVNPSQNKLSLNGHPVKVETRVMSLLVYLAYRNGEAVAIDELVEHVWNDRVVSNSAVYRAMAELRKVLSQDGSVEYIKTINKKGYLLNAEVHLAKSNGANQLKWFLFLCILIVLFIIGYLISQQLFERTADKNSSEQSNYILEHGTSLPGKEMYPDISPDGSLMLLVHKENQDSPSEIFIHVLSTAVSKIAGNLSEEVRAKLSQRTFQLTNQGSDILYPSWSADGNFVSYMLKKNGQCEVRIADFDWSEMVLRNHRQVALCSMLDGRAVTWSSRGHTLLYVSIISGRLSVHAVNAGTLENEILSSTAGTNSWSVYVASSPFENKLMILNFVDYQRTEFLHFDLETKQSELIHSVPVLVDSVAWGENNNELIYQRTRNTYSKFNWKTKQETVFWDNTTKVGQISRSPTGKFYALEKLNQSEENIEVVTISPPLESQKQQQRGITWKHNSSYSDSNPEFSHSMKKVAFVSTRSGESQLWIAEENGTLRQVTDFNNEAWMGRVRWSGDDNQLLFARGGSIYFYDFSRNQLFDVVDNGVGNQRVAYSPNWSIDGKSIFYSTLIDGKNLQYELSMQEDNRTNKQVGTDIRNVQQAENGDLYYTRLAHHGIYRYNVKTGESELFVENVHAENWNAWRVVGKHLYYFDQFQTEPSIWSIDMATLVRRKVKNWPDMLNGTFSVSSDHSLMILNSYRYTESDIVILRKLDTKM